MDCEYTNEIISKFSFKYLGLKENNPQQNLLQYAREQSKLQYIRKNLAKPNGGIFNGVIPDEKWALSKLGDTFNKTILASKGVEKIESFTALGGWCALRTKCMKQISSGHFCDLESESMKSIHDKNHFYSWLKNAVSLDQIVESIGIHSGSEYTAISEQKLWAEKLYNNLIRYQNITTKQTELYQRIFDSIAIAEEKRFKITKRYVEYIGQKEVNFTQVRDYDIFEELIEARDQLLTLSNTSITELSKKILLNRTKNPTPKIYKDVSEYVSNYSIVWFMYTGLYLDILKRNKYVNTDYALILEPWSHAKSNEAEAEFNFRVFGADNGKNNYLVEGGSNEKIGFVALDEVSRFNWKKIKVEDNINTVPNYLNYKEFFDKFLASNNDKLSNITLADNPAFIMGYNFLPYGKTKALLNGMIKIYENFKHERSIYKMIEDDDLDLKRLKIDRLKESTSHEMEKLSKLVIEELSKMCNYIFSI